MFVVGTAGHVDHGKSTLVKALTGIDPDRLREERERAMTIDLGFAWLTLPGGREVSVVDVPGHERFIKNMLAGVGGIDAALLVVAADEGPMPQTAEHLAILDLLGIGRGLVALTKRDLVDGDWLDLVREETRERLAGTALADVPLVAVSAVTGEGLDELLAALDRVLDGAPPRAATGRPRLPIDRVFTISGFGTVVTGTLSDGILAVGQEVEIVPAGRRGRIRGLQSHRTKVTEAQPGSRVAVNLAGLAVDELRRGDVLTAPGWLAPTDRLDAHLALTADAPVELEQNDEVDFFLGADEVPARVTLLDTDRLRPGESGWVQLRLARPTAALKGDRFIVRRPSPGITIGGGAIVDAHPRRHKRFQAAALDALATLERGTPDELLLQALAAGPLDLKTLGERAHLPAETLRDALAATVADGRATLLAGDPAAPHPADVVAAAPVWAALRARMAAILGGHHAQFPLRRGMSKEEFRSRLGLTPRIYEAAAAAALREGAAASDGATFRLPAHRITFTPAQQEIVDRYLAALAVQPYAPPSPAEFGVPPDVLAALAETGAVVRVDEAVAFAPAAYDALVAETLRLIDEEGTITLARFRDRFDTSRKYAQAVLEHFDQAHLTRRVGDARVRGVAAK
ncbi:MAG TPA: selenocysteine-specific translation elongation factor [Thermomicrobiales bacterium]|nr:selenocysteine-specific translation elongation factor [Thermomicrobiales bacterium]